MRRDRITESGISALEIIAVMTIMFLFSALAMPEVATMLDSFEKRNFREQFELDVRMAKLQASAEGARSFISFNADRTYTIGVDYPPYSTPAVADKVIATTSIPQEAGVLVSQSILFNSRGYLIDNTGQLSNLTFDLIFKGETFADGSIFATGSLSYQ